LTYLCLVVIGLGFLLSSIIISISKILYPTKKIPEFNVGLFYQDLKKGETEDTILEVYLIHIDEISRFVTKKARWLAKIVHYYPLGNRDQFYRNIVICFIIVSR